MRRTCSEQSYFAKRDLAIPFEELLNIRCAKGFCHCSKYFLSNLNWAWFFGIFVCGVWMSMVFFHFEMHAICLAGGFNHFYFHFFSPLALCGAFPIWVTYCINNQLDKCSRWTWQNRANFSYFQSSSVEVLVSSRPPSSISGEGSLICMLWSGSLRFSSHECKPGFRFFVVFLIVLWT